MKDLKIYVCRLCLLSHNLREMNQKVKDLIKIVKGAGHKINPQKSKIM
jgi:hypothetical protein